MPSVTVAVSLAIALMTKAAFVTSAIDIAIANAAAAMGTAELITANDAFSLKTTF